MNIAAKKLQSIQTELVAPKNLINKFGGYNYRSAESILEALKPHLAKHDAILTISDEIIEVGGRVYVKATVTFSTEGESLSTSAYAREPESKKGSDESQITGAASSYARKYALNGLFCIDDTKDADATNDHGKAEPSKQSQSDGLVAKIIDSFNMQTTIEALDAKMEKAKSTPFGNDPRVLEAYDRVAHNLNK
jgi:hypothetical protein